MKFADKAPKEVADKPSEADQQADYYKGFRSAVVLAWVFCNFALAAVVLNSAGLSRTSKDSKEKEVQEKRANIYMSVVLWSVAALSAFKFTGAVWYLIVRMVSF